MAQRFFIQTHGKKYVAVPEDYSLERSFTARSPQGILRYFVIDGQTWRKTYYVLIRMPDDSFRVYYRDRTQFSGRKFTQSIINAYNVRPVRTLRRDELPALLEPHHIRQVNEAEKWLTTVEPAGEVTTLL